MNIYTSYFATNLSNQNSEVRMKKYFKFRTIIKFLRHFVIVHHRDRRVGGELISAVPPLDSKPCEIDNLFNSITI